MKKNDEIYRLMAIPFGGAIIFLLSLYANKNSNIKYVFIGLLISLIFLTILKKFNYIDPYTNDEMKIYFLNKIFSIVFILSLILLTFLIIALYFIGIKYIPIENIILLILTLWLTILIAKIALFFKIRR